MANSTTEAKGAVAQPNPNLEQGKQESEITSFKLEVWATNMVTTRRIWEITDGINIEDKEISKNDELIELMSLEKWIWNWTPIAIPLKDSPLKYKYKATATCGGNVSKVEYTYRIIDEYSFKPIVSAGPEGIIEIELPKQVSKYKLEVRFKIFGSSNKIRPFRKILNHNLYVLWDTPIKGRVESDAYANREAWKAYNENDTFANTEKPRIDWLEMATSSISKQNEPTDVLIARALLEGIERNNRNWHYLLPSEGAYTAAWLIEKRKPADWDNQNPGTDVIGYTNVLLTLAHSLGLNMNSTEQVKSENDILPNEEYEVYYTFGFHVKHLKEVLFRFYSQNKPKKSEELWDRVF